MGYHIAYSMATTSDEVTVVNKDIRSGQSVLFQLSMYWRIFYGIIRILVSIKLLQLVGMPIADVLSFYVGDPARHPNDHVYALIQNTLQQHSFVVTYFLATYLLFWGAVDIFLSYNLLRDKIWAFPVSLYLIGVFMVYEIVRLTHTHSLLLFTFICIDITIMFLIYREYQRMQAKYVCDEE